MRELTIQKNDADQRLDRFLLKAVPLLPASLAQKYIRLKRIKVNGARAERDYRLREVEHITSPEALLVDCMVQNDCTAKDAIKLLLKDENNTYSKNELYAAHLALKERFG